MSNAFDLDLTLDPVLPNHSTPLELCERRCAAIEKRITETMDHLLSLRAELRAVRADVDKLKAQPSIAFQGSAEENSTTPLHRVSEPAVRLENVPIRPAETPPLADTSNQDATLHLQAQRSLQQQQIQRQRQHAAHEQQEQVRRNLLQFAVVRQLHPQQAAVQVASTELNRNDVGASNSRDGDVRASANPPRPTEQPTSVRSAASTGIRSGSVANSGAMRQYQEQMAKHQEQSSQPSPIRFGALQKQTTPLALPPAAPAIVAEQVSRDVNTELKRNEMTQVAKRIATDQSSDARQAKARRTGGAPGGPIPEGRYYHSGTPLPNGDVFVFGGLRSATEAMNDAWVLAPKTKVWRKLELSGVHITPRCGHAAVVTASGKIWLAGGGPMLTTGPRFTDAYLIDTVTGAVSSVTLPDVSGMKFHTATVLPNGHILVCYGSPLQRTQQMFLIAPDMAITHLQVPVWFTARDGVAACIQGENVFFFGGCRVETAAEGFNDVFAYNFTSGLFRNLGAPQGCPPGAKNGAVLIPAYDNQILVMGGFSGAMHDGNVLLYEIELGRWNKVMRLRSPRGGHTFCLLPDQKTIVLFGGCDHSAHYSNEVMVFHLSDRKARYAGEIELPNPRRVYWVRSHPWMWWPCYRANKHYVCFGTGQRFAIGDAGVEVRLDHPSADSLNITQRSAAFQKAYEEMLQFRETATIPQVKDVDLEGDLELDYWEKCEICGATYHESTPLSEFLLCSFTGCIGGAHSKCYKEDADFVCLMHRNPINQMELQQ